MFLFFCLVFSVLNQKITELKNGVLTGPYSVAQWESAFFKFEPNLQSGMIIAIQDDLGDSDIFASCATEYPDETNFMWNEEYPGADNIPLKADDLKKGGDCETVYIGVKAYSPQNVFSIISYSINSTIDIEMGDSQPGFVFSQNYDYYRYRHLDATKNITITVNAVPGQVEERDVDIFVGVDFIPNRYEYTYCGTSASPTAETLSFTVSPGYSYSIVLFAYRGDSFYRISVTEKTD